MMERSFKNTNFNFESKALINAHDPYNGSSKHSITSGPRQEVSSFTFHKSDVVVIV